MLQNYLLTSDFTCKYSQERFYFGDHVLPCFETGIPLLKERLILLPDADNVRRACFSIT